MWIFTLIGEIIIGGVGIIGSRDEEVGVRIGAEVSGEEIVEIEGIPSCGKAPSCGKTKFGDVGVVWSSHEVERIGEV